MRYTKYQYKKKSNGINFLTSLVMMIVGAGAIGIIVGTIVVRTVWPNKEINIINENKEVVANESSQKETFTSIQCGYFSKEENANKVLEDLGSGYNSFIVKENDKFRVLVGVFTEEDGEKILTEVKAKGKEVTKIKFTLDESDKVQEQVSAITDGYFKIITRLKEDEVKFVSTNDFKVWTNELPKLEEGKGVEVINDFKKHIESLPSELKRENLTEELKYIYTILVNFKK